MEARELRGDKALLPELPVVEVGGRRIELRRLDYSDIARLSRILLISKQHAGIDLPGIAASAVVGNPAEALARVSEAAVTVALAALGYAEAEVQALIAHACGVQVGEVRDAKLFPPADLPALFGAIWDHPDVQGFAEAAVREAKRRTAAAQSPRPTPTTSSSEPATSSSADTDIPPTS